LKNTDKRGESRGICTSGVRKSEDLKKRRVETMRKRGGGAGKAAAKTFKTERSWRKIENRTTRGKCGPKAGREPKGSFEVYNKKEKSIP